MSQQIQDAIEKISSQMEVIEKKFDEKTRILSEHPSQNGGWKKFDETLKRIEAQVTAIDISLNDPNNGAIAKLNDQIAWRSRVDPILDDNRKQDERLLKLEMQLHLYNKITWALGLGMAGLILKAVMGLVIPT